MTVAPEQTELVTVTIDGIDISVPKGTLLIRAAEQLGIQIPRFCDHPLLEPAGACRQCLVEVTDMGNGRGMPKPAASCTTTVMPGMVIKTQLTSPVADKAQQGVMELLLINHPLDCPVCDKGGECPLQNQALQHGEKPERIVSLDAWEESPLYTDKERAALAWVEELTLIADSGASKESFDALKPHFSEEEIGWLILAAVQINSWNRIAISSRAQYDRAMFAHAAPAQKATEPA